MINDSRVDVKAQFKKINTDVYGFVVDKTIPENSLLVIDPATIRLWGTYFGGPDMDAAESCSVDRLGNVFLAGHTRSLTNIATTGAYQDTLTGNYDGFVAKFSAGGGLFWIE